MEYNKLLKAWYERQEWSAFPFQESLAQAYAEGLHGLLNAPTGSGKTYAMFLPALCYSISQESNRKKAGHLRIDPAPVQRWQKNDRAPETKAGLVPLVQRS